MTNDEAITPSGEFKRRLNQAIYTAIGKGSESTMAVEARKAVDRYVAQLEQRIRELETPSGEFKDLLEAAISARVALNRVNQDGWESQYTEWKRAYEACDRYVAALDEEIRQQKHMRQDYQKKFEIEVKRAMKFEAERDNYKLQVIGLTRTAQENHEAYKKERREWEAERDALKEKLKALETRNV